MSKAYELQGNVIKIGETQTFGSGFEKREFVVKVEDGKYPQEIKFEVVNDNCGLLDELKLGEEVDVKFDIRGKPYKETHYNNLVAWKIVKVGIDDQPPSAKVSQVPWRLR